MNEKNKRDIGKEGENIAAKYLTEKGFEIIERGTISTVTVKLILLQKTKSFLCLLKLKQD